ncbi:MAG: hypothetical protein RDU89_07885 [bacterium]|nr:hypothetical protein [bacterium]
MFRIILQELLDVVELYGEEGQVLAPTAFAFVRDGPRVNVWPIVGEDRVTGEAVSEQETAGAEDRQTGAPLVSAERRSTDARA